MQQWEYHLESVEPKFFQGFDLNSIQQILSALGNDGWELVSTEDINYDGSSGKFIFIFKRPI